MEEQLNWNNGTMDQWNNGKWNNGTMKLQQWNWNNVAM